MFKATYVLNFVLISTSLARYREDDPFRPAEQFISERTPLDDDNEYEADYEKPIDDEEDDEEEPTFDGIYERRKNFDVETPMDLPAPTHGSQPTELSQTADDDQPLLLDEPYNDSIQSDDDYNGQHLSSSELTDDSPSESDIKTESLLSDDCLRCICHASSECDPQVRCHVEGDTVYKCGPFQIDVNYWNDAGSPGADQRDPLDFESCMSDIQCSIETVNAYMKKWSHDCDRDGHVSCDDYAKVHRSGKYQCNSTWILGTPYWTKYKNCYTQLT
ncbi:uncharacterized protein LOC128965175 [Oppia nitens]|uniref:uncharacterized protein LOC128965175 n=1 Tax=Oppia nitens TaxID=1686743 RepID=UPI0023DBC7D8|nr:uncharacterized protein LOC128965175 [Oppia nitens]